MHILFLTDNFPPEVNAPASRTFEHCIEWVKAGHKVTVITCVPNFPVGKVFKGYKNKLWQTENMGGIRVIRVWSYITANAGFIKRILDYISFMPPAVLASFFVRKPDLVIGTSPQFFTVCAAYLVSFFKCIPFVFELRDIWPESIKAVGAMNDSIIIKVLEKIELFLYRKATLIISVTHAFKKTLVERGVDADKINIVTNGVDVSRFYKSKKDDILVKKYGLEGKFVAGYVGTHGMAHHLETILDAACIAQDNDDDIRFLLLGNGARKQQLIALAGTMGLHNIIFVDSVTKKDVARYWSLLDASIIHLKKIELFTSVIPSKLFECMAMGIPVLHGVMGESAEIVEHNKVGFTFEPENEQQLYEFLIKLKENTNIYQEFQENAVNASKNYDRRVLARKFLALLSKFK
ncbi:MAG: colanic acid biosynthesis glycosyl transferase WcaI [Methyloprofundus sp.]|nr:MAG: colanic acid biosynthesis glycosyl transferase WcaI [Methyloprofundus sp.]